MLQGAWTRRLSTKCQAVRIDALRPVHKAAPGLPISAVPRGWLPSYPTRSCQKGSVGCTDLFGYPRGHRDGEQEFWIVKAARCHVRCGPSRNDTLVGCWVCRRRCRTTMHEMSMARRGRTAVVRRAIVACPPCANCPSRQDVAGQAYLPYSANQKYDPPVLARQEGRIASRHDTRARMRWTRWRRARFVRTNGARAYGKVAWSWPPDAEAK